MSWTTNIIIGIIIGLAFVFVLATSGCAHKPPTPWNYYQTGAL